MERTCVCALVLAAPAPPTEGHKHVVKCCVLASCKAGRQGAGLTTEDGG